MKKWVCSYQKKGLWKNFQEMQRVDRLVIEYREIQGCFSFTIAPQNNRIPWNQQNR